MHKIPHFNAMVVEDEVLLRRSLVRHINDLDAGFSVTAEASNGEEALMILSQNDIHLIFTDIRMPIMEGIELLQAVSVRYPHIKVVLLSGYAEFSYAQQALRIGALDYLLKPVTENALERVLSNAKLALSSRYTLEEDSLLSCGTSEHVMELARRFLCEHYTENIDMAALSARLGFSPAYLTKLFNKLEGCSPVKFLTNLRINEARHLLLNTDLPIKEVGERVGYPDQFYFSNVFRKSVGQSPSMFRLNSPTGSDDT